ncbi:MAG TPA: lysophospholipid acyltransferase family protein [Candidatus Binataceae bacterium]|nr:lysophospholipid acyltransferase family protein [Candidatus Binataceae bacterium]
MARQIGRVRGWLEVSALAVPWSVLRMLPLERAVRVGALLGGIAAAVDYANRSIGLRNLEIAFPELTREARLTILRDAYRNYGRMAAEWVHAFALKPTNIDRYVGYAGREHWDDAIQRSDGRGILTLTGHFGNFELLSIGHALHGNRVALIQRPNRNPVLDAAVTARRERFGNRAIPRRGAGLTALRLLRENWMVAVPLDLDNRQGVFVDFFGLKAATSPALARIAMATGAPVLPAFMVRSGTSTHHSITCLPVIELVREGPREEAVLENTRRYTAVIESMIRRHPDHWNWIHRRWKTRPPGEARFY